MGHADVDFVSTLEQDVTTSDTDPVPEESEAPEVAETQEPEPASVEPDPEPDPDRNDEHLRVLSRERSKLRAELQALETQRLEVERLRAQHSDLESLRELMQRDPEAAAEKLGLDYDKWTRAILEGKRAAPDPIAPVKSEIQELREQLKALKEENEAAKAAWQRQQVEQQHVVAVRAAKEKFPGLVTHADADIGRAIAAIIDSRPEESLDTTSAAVILERKLRSDYERLHGAYGPPTPKAAAPTRPRKGTAPTDKEGETATPLTQAVTATTRPDKEGPLTREDYVRRAYAALDALED